MRIAYFLGVGGGGVGRMLRQEKESLDKLCHDNGMLFL